jgi:hypothetical protein
MASPKLFGRLNCYFDLAKALGFVSPKHADTLKAVYYQFLYDALLFPGGVITQPVVATIGI